MLMINYVNAEIIWNEDLNLFTLTGEDLEDIDILLEEGETYMKLYNEAKGVITKAHVDVTNLGTIINDLEAENRKLKVQKFFFSVGGIAVGAGLVLLLSNIIQ